MKRIQSKMHKLGTYEIYKISLSCFDEKRCVQMMEFVGSLIFIKMMSQVVKRLKNILIKKIVITEKDCNNQKNIVMIKKRL